MLLQCFIVTVMQIKLTVVVAVVVVEDVPLTFFYFLSTLPTIFNMHEPKFLHELYLRITRTKYVKK